MVVVLFAILCKFALAETPSSRLSPASDTLGAIETRLSEAVVAYRTRGDALPLRVVLDDIVESHFPENGSFERSRVSEGINSINFKIGPTDPNNPDLVMYYYEFVSNIEYRFVSYYEVTILINAIDDRIVRAQGFALYRTIL